MYRQIGPGLMEFVKEPPDQKYSISMFSGYLKLIWYGWLEAIESIKPFLIKVFPKSLDGQCDWQVKVKLRQHGI